MSDLMNQAVIGMPYDMAMSSEMSRLQFHSRAQLVLAERDTLLAQVATLQSAPDSYQSGFDAGRKHYYEECKRLRAQVEAMRLLLTKAAGQIETLADSMENLTEDDPEDGTSEILTEARDLAGRIDAALQAKP